MNFKPAPRREKSTWIIWIKNTCLRNLTLEGDIQFPAVIYFPARDFLLLAISLLSWKPPECSAFQISSFCEQCSPSPSCMWRIQNREEHFRERTQVPNSQRGKCFFFLMEYHIPHLLSWGFALQICGNGLGINLEFKQACGFAKTLDLYTLQRKSIITNIWNPSVFFCARNWPQSKSMTC